MSKYVTTPDGKRYKFPDQATPEQIRAALSRYVTVPKDSAAAPATAMTPEFNPLMNQLAGLRGRALESLPTVGGIAGGLAGTPGGIPGMFLGATAGGAAGEAARQRAMGQPIAPLGIARRGAEQGLYELGGAGLALGARTLARPVMKGALVATRRLAASFPDITETAIKYRLPATEAGERMATRLRDQSANRLQLLLIKAEASGTVFDANRVAREANQMLRNPAIRNADKAAMMREVDAFVSQHQRKINPTLLKKIKQEYQALASPVYARELDIGSAPTRRVAKQIAAGAKRELETIPGVAAQEAKTQSLIGVTRAIRERNLKPTPLATTWELQKPMTYPLARSLARPEVQSTVALWLTDPTFQAILRQSPRLLGWLYGQMRYSAEPDATLQGP